MKKLTCLTMMMVLMLCCTVISFAQETDKMKNPTMGKEIDMDKMIQGCKMRMCPMMMGRMNKSMVITANGDVIVLMGNKLLKYDKSLEFKKEVMIKEEPMQLKGLCPKCQEMMKNKVQCPMCGKMMQDGGVKEKDK